LVDRCICRDVPFTRIAQLRAEGHGFRQAVERTGCCTGCGLCEPYVRLVLETGLTVLPILSAAEIARVQSGCAGEPTPYPRAWKA
jgi:bacterioferritin-associated ferredoxin